jgi:hypothetical protein
MTYAYFWADPRIRNGAAFLLLAGTHGKNPEVKCTLESQRMA